MIKISIIAFSFIKFQIKDKIYISKYPYAYVKRHNENEY